VVTTAAITDATPAASYAHSPDRYWQSDADLPPMSRCRDIAAQLVDDNSDINVRLNVISSSEQPYIVLVVVVVVVVGGGGDGVAVAPALKEPVSLIQLMGRLSCYEPEETHMTVYAGPILATQQSNEVRQSTVGHITRQKRIHSVIQHSRRLSFCVVTAGT